MLLEVVGTWLTKTRKVLAISCHAYSHLVWCGCYKTITFWASLAERYLAINRFTSASLCEADRGRWRFSVSSLIWCWKTMQLIPTPVEELPELEELYRKYVLKVKVV